VFQGKPKTDQVITMAEGHVHIRSWEEFKRTVNEKKPTSIVFILEQNGFSPNKELTTLKLIMLHDKRYYIFYDFPKGDALRQTGIPLHKDKNGIPNLDDVEVKAYLEGQFPSLEVYSFWTA
jgi:hypothetical protein